MLIVMPEFRIPDEMTPPDLRRLTDALQEAGFVQIEERYDPVHFGNATLTLRREQLLVQAERDRSPWLIKMAGVAWGHSFFVATWQSCLNGEVLPATPQRPSEDDLASQVDLTLDLIPKLALLEPAVFDSMQAKMWDAERRQFFLSMGWRGQWTTEPDDDDPGPGAD
jgi:hypothetical protein